MITKRVAKQGCTLQRKTLLQRMARDWQLYALVFLPMVAVFIFHYVPIYGIQLAFRNYSAKRGYWGSEWVGLKHFIKFFNYPNFWKIIWNTLRITLLTLVTFPLPIILAIMFNDLKDGLFKRATQMLTYAPHFVSTVVVGAMVILFLNPEVGVINTIVELFGGERQDWLAKPENFAPIYVISGLWQDLGWDTIIYLAALSGISQELIEAAKVDGASRMKIVRHIYIPHLLPTIVTIFILKCGGLFAVGFEKIFLLQNPLNLSASTVISTYVYEVGIINGQLSYSTAINLFQSVIALIVIFVVNFISRKVSETSLW